MKPAEGAVRHAAIEAALADLERALCRDRCHAVVSVPAGPARTLLQGALAERLAGALRVVHLPDPGADGDLCAAILRELGEQPGDDAEASLLGIARRLASHGSALALVAGEARSLPAPTLRRLGRLAALGRPGLRLVLVSAVEAGSDRDASADIMASLGVGAVKIVVDAPALRGRPAPATAQLARSASPAPAARPAGFAPIRVTDHSGRRGARLAWLAALGLALAVGLATIQRPDTPAEQAAARPAPAAPAPRAAAAEPPRAASAAAAHAPVDRGAPRVAPAPLALAAEVPQSDREAQDVATPTLAAPRAAEIAEVAEPAAATLLPPPAADATAAVAPDPLPLGVAAEEDAGPPERFAPEVFAASDAEITPPIIRVSLNAQPWAHIEVDGRDVGVTPMADLPLHVGLHRFRARFPDGRVIERTVRVDAVRDHIHFP